MAIIKCKMCGGDIVLNEEKTFGTCEYCGSVMTLPKVSDEQRAALFNRGNHFRRIGEFDKALAIYENIVREDDNDAEAHWCCALCRFGIEYVADPNTYEYLPTCHRASFDSFLEDPDCKAALEHSDGVTRRQYQRDAAKIAEVQRGILATSQNEEPYDVFICYKETDDQTKERTRDSIDAQEIYYQLTQAGYRTFFSRITLEDKAGTEYEPYIFAALNSAKVMVAIGSKPEYFNAVWVKNEWSRFLAMMRKDRSKLLLPCYKNMDPYDLPEQLGVLQSYDMTKIGFMQDLIRGIKKVLQKDEPKSSPPQQAVQQVVQSGGPNVTALLDRGAMALEDRQWDNAAEYYDQVLNQDAKNGAAYLGLALAKAQCSSLDAFVQKRADQFTDEPAQKLQACEPETARIDALAKKLAVPGYLTEDEIRKPFEFDLAYPSREKAAQENKTRTLAALSNDRHFSRAKQYADAALREKLSAAERQIEAACDRRIEKAKADAATAKTDVIERYQTHLEQQEKETGASRVLAIKKRETDYQRACKTQETASTEQHFSLAAESFESEGLRGYLDSNARAGQCRAEYTRLREEKKQQKEKAEAEAQKRRKKNTKIGIIAAAVAVIAIAAVIIVTTIIILNNKYNAAVKLYEDGKYEEAIAAFEALDGYKDSADKLGEIRHSTEWMKLCPVGETLLFGNYEQDDNTSTGKEEIEWIVLAKESSRILVVSKYALDGKQYNTEYTSVTWETCSLRKWLNSEFLNAAFTAEEQKLIPTVTVSADKNPNYSTNPGQATQDKVFLLNISEVNKYFKSDEARKCAPTDYAVAQGAYTSNSEKVDGRATCWWWLRSPGCGSDSAAGVRRVGSVSASGDGVDRGNGAVRPALWINLEP